MSEDLLPYFLTEGRELVDRASEALVELERAEAPAEPLEAAFRALHTLKGSAGLFDLPELGAMLHAAESGLEALRRGGGRPDPARLGLLMDCVAETERWLDELEAGGPVPAARRAAAAGLAGRLQGGAEAPARADAPAGEPAGWAQALLEAAGEAAADARAAVAYAPDPDAYFRGEDPLALMRAVPDLRWLELDRTAAGPPGPEDSPFVCGLVLRALSAAEPEDVRAVFRRVGDQAQVVPLAPVRPAAPAARAPGRTVRVDAAGLAAVSELVDELIIAKNVLAHETAQALGEGASQGVAAAQLALERAVTALHGAVGRITLAPLGRLFSRLPRQVREMAEAVGKEVELAVTGEDVVVDKPIMDALYEPLIHLLRNAVDHGLEPPGERRAAGKPARGLIRIAARTHGDTAVIEVTDDGRGLDFRKIRAAAVARGVVSEAAAAALEDREAAELIFASGFSTAREVSDLSGRGVGLDAVRAALAAVGGRIEVDSRPGEGTTMRLIAPFRTVLARVAVLQVGQDRFGAPLEAIREVVRVPRAQVTAVRAGEAVVVREEVIPLLHLGRLLGGGPSAADPLAVLVVDGPDGRVGVAVDRVAESLQAPIQAPSPLLAGLAGLQGSILQGDGRVLLVLDLAGLTS